eukprot:6213472-Pleurochrysis_carterae.AAC.9
MAVLPPFSLGIRLEGTVRVRICRRSAGRALLHLDVHHHVALHVQPGRHLLLRRLRPGNGKAGKAVCMCVCVLSVFERAREENVSGSG